MAIDFAVIIAVRQRFGDGLQDNKFQHEGDVPLVGKSKDFPFSCPNVSPKDWAVLQFQSLGIDFSLHPSIQPHRNILQINGSDIPGGLTPGPSGNTRPLWNTHSLLVPPNLLNEQNVLHVESISSTSGIFGASNDDFMIDNAVVFFKTPA